MDIGLIKKSAKNLLKDYWVRSITAVMLVIAVSATVSILAECVLSITGTELTSAIGYGILLAASAVGTFLSSPLLLGYRRILWLRSEGETPSLTEVFYYFGKAKWLFKYFGLNLVRSIIVYLPAVLLIAPVLVFIYLADLDTSFITQFSISFSAADLDYMFIIKICCLLLVVGGIILSAFMSIRYTVSDYLFIDNPDNSIKAILGTSSRLCLNCKGRIILLYLSFMPWFLLNSTGFGRLYSVPYFSAALVRLTRAFMANDLPSAPVEQPPAPTEQTAVFETPTDGGAQ